MLIDIHSHLDHHLLFNKLDGIIERAGNAGVKLIITNGINPETNRKCLEISRKYNIVKCAMGLYPRDALKKDIGTGDYPLKNESFDINEEIDFIRKNKNNIVAISEIGLDFVDGESRQQIDDFRKMIKLAREMDKPMIIHSRKAEQKCVEILEEYDFRKIIMHCFCGKKSLVKRIVDNGWYLTIPTVVRSEQFQQNARVVPIEQLFCETDSPYLSPYKEKLNEPAFVIESYNKISEIKGMPMSKVVEKIHGNWKKLFE